MRAGTAATQQTLTLPAQQVLHHAINDARGRCHSQVQPLHVASMLLAHPGSPLRQACSASHTESPTQGGLEKCRALELCFKVALDRLTANPTVPPIPQPPPVLSNALNAALKRAQAHQRRGCPEQQQPPLLAVKVEIEQLIISILDDPSVSRVMKEAGFSSTHVKSYLEDLVGSQPTSPDNNVNANMAVFNYNMGVGTGGFLGRPMLPDTQLTALAGAFPMLQPGGVRDMPDVVSFIPRTHSMLVRAPSPIMELPPSPTRENEVRQAMEVMLRPSSLRNPVLVGDSLASVNAVFQQLQSLIRVGDVAEELCNVQILTPDFSSQSFRVRTQQEMDEKLMALSRKVDECMPRGCIVHIGDLQWFVDRLPPNPSGSSTYCAVTHVAVELERILDRHKNNHLWFIGVALSHNYVQCQALHPTLESKWGLQRVSIASPINFGPNHRFSRSLGSPPLGLPTSRTSPMMVRPPPGSVGGSIGGQQQRPPCCPQCMAQLEAECNQVHEQERTLLGQEVSQSFSDTSRKGTEGSSAPLPSWLQKEKDMKTEKVKTQSILQKMQDLQHKWQNTCRTRHGIPVSSPANMTHSSSPLSRMNAGIPDTGKSLALMRSTLNNPTPKPLANSVAQPSLVPGHPHRAQTSSPMSPLASRAALQQAGGVVSSPVTASSRFVSGIRVSPPVAANSSSKDGSSIASALEDPEDKSTETSEQEGFGAPFSIDLALGRPKPSPFMKSSMSPKIQDHHYRLQQCTQDPSEGASPLRRLGQSPLLVNNAPGNHLMAKSPLSMFSPMRTGQTVTPVSSNPTFNNNQVLKTPAVFNQRVADGLKHVYKGLMERVPWQAEAIAATSTAVLNARSGLGKCRGMTAKADSWLLFLGPDQVGKRMIANTLSELVFGSGRKPIWFGIPSSSAWGNLDEDMDGIQYRGRTPLDKMVEALKKNPLSVLLLEDIDKADEYVRSHLSRAMETGKLTDSSGRQVSVSNAIVIMTVGVIEESVTTAKGQQQEELPLSERKLTHLGGVRMRLALESPNNNRRKVLFRGGPMITVVEYVDNSQDLNNSGLIMMSAKRKGDRSVDSVAPDKRTKVASPARAIALDLNLSAEENEEAVDGEDNNPNGCLEETTSAVYSGVCKYDERNRESVIQDARKRFTLKFYSLVDEMIIFKPYDFKGQAAQVLSRLAQACASFITSNGAAGIEVEFSSLEHIVASIWKKPGGEHLFELWVKENFEKRLSSLMSDNEMAAVEERKVLKIDMVDKILLQEPTSSGYGLPLQIEVGSSRY